ncbi:MAG: transcription antitermination factor NusB [Spirochaetota bacterium]|nr:transcription antitermination factor NusB [Spirochaetota bacterium]
MGKRHKAREIVLQGLYQYEIGKKDLQDILLFDWINKKRVPLEILLFAEELLRGTIQNLTIIDKLIKKNLDNWDFNKISAIDRNILRFSTFSIIFQLEIPFIVTINEAIDIARKFGGEQSFRFVNGVLDGILKEINLKKHSINN